jgi:hypothetical protein
MECVPVSQCINGSSVCASVGRGGSRSADAWAHLAGAKHGQRVIARITVMSGMASGLGVVVCRMRDGCVGAVVLAGCLH